MALEIFFKYLHFISIFFIVGALVGEHLLLKPQMTRAEIQRIFRLDGIYGVAAITLLIAGFTLWFGVGKPAEFYAKNWIFHAKIGLFTLVGLLSAYPTIFFMRERKGDEQETVDIPSKIVWFIRIELLLVFLMPLLASLMAKGIGYFG